MLPFKQLWDTAFDYVEQKNHIQTTKLSNLNVDEMNNKMLHWLKNLQGLKKKQPIVGVPGPKMLRNIIASELDEMKEFLPIIQ
jgi:hypothetical protein